MKSRDFEPGMGSTRGNESTRSMCDPFRVRNDVLFFYPGFRYALPWAIVFDRVAVRRSRKTWTIINKTKG
jgi:hypothetical protein